jgi:hypothetical protein
MVSQGSQYEAAHFSGIAHCEAAMNAAPPPPHHAGHYRSQADTFRQLAEIEPIAEVRELLLKIAEQYDKLADHLSRRR